MPKRSRSGTLTIIFDGDDTLWWTMPLYTQAKRRFFDCMEKLGFERGEVEHSFERRDAKNVDRWGFTVERFRRSMVETLEEFFRAKGEIPRPRLVERVSHIAGSVSRNKTRRMPGARAVLRLLDRRYRLVLLTKGEYALQERRVLESGFSGFFEAIFIVEHKDRAAFERICAELSLDLRSTWSVGDSLRSDIKPALAAGLGAIWIPQETWDYESIAPKQHRRLIRLKTVKELPQALKQAAQHL